MRMKRGGFFSTHLPIVAPLPQGQWRQKIDLPLRGVPTSLDRSRPRHRRYPTVAPVAISLSTVSKRSFFFFFAASSMPWD